MNRNVEKAKDLIIFSDSNKPIERGLCYKAIEIASAPDWHLVSENDLPNSNGDYLCIDINGKQRIEYYSININFQCITEIIAWTYLPKYSK